MSHAFYDGQEPPTLNSISSEGVCVSLQAKSFRKMIPHPANC